MHSMSYRDVIDMPEIWSLISGTVGSDYSGSLVERSNYEWFIDNHSKDPDLCRVYGEGFTYGIAMRKSSEDPDLQEVVAAIQEHGTICDDTYNRLVMDAIHEAIDSWALKEFQDKTQRIYGGDDVDLWYDVSDDLADRIFEACRVASNEDWVDEHGTMWLDVDSLVNYFPVVIKTYPSNYTAA